MSISSIKALTWLFAFGVGGFLAWTVYDFVEKKPELRQPISGDEQRKWLEGVPEPEPPRNDVVAYTKVESSWNQFDWTGKPPVKQRDVVKDTGPPPPLKDPVSDLLTVLIITVDGDDSKASRATVKYLNAALAKHAEAAGSTVLREGDRLANPYEHIEVASIRPEGVEFAFDDEERESELVATIQFESKNYIVKVGPEGAVVRTRDPLIDQVAEKPLEVPKESLLIGKDHWLVGLNDREALANNYSKILAELRYDAHRDTKTGKKDGIELTSVPKGSFAAKYGAKEGQVIKSINGHPVTSVNEAISYCKQNADKYDIWKVVYEEQGVEKVKIIDTSDS